MANTFKRYTSNSIGTSLATVYTVPSSPSTTSVMIGGVVSNVSSTTVNVTVTATTSSTVINLIGEDTPLPAGTALSFIDGKVVLEDGDIVKIKSSAATSVDAHLSVMEIT